MTKRIALILPVITFGSLFGCASYPAPQQHMADSAAAVRGAEEVGAAAQPQAALNLKLAHEELARAKALMDVGKNEEADFMTSRAKADADLALALAREETARTRAQQGESKVKAVENGAQIIPLPVPSPVLPASPSTVAPR
jgi:uncharacterized protein YqfA (UPF0365 family)